MELQREKVGFSKPPRNRFHKYIRTLTVRDGNYNFLRLAGGKLLVKNKSKFMSMFLKNFVKFTDKANLGGLVQGA